MSAGYETALRFIEAFPEAKAFSVTILSADKKTTQLHKPECARTMLMQNLMKWTANDFQHVFVRPLMGNVIMVDLDSYAGSFDVLLQLRPRVLAGTSPGTGRAP